MTAARAARSMGMTHMVTIDADGQHDPDEFERFVTVMQRNPSAILVGRRDFSSDSIPRGRRFGRAFSNFWLRAQTGRRIGDAQSGFRAYPLKVLEKLKLREKGFTFEIEVLVKAAWAGVELVDVDVSVVYAPEGGYVSHFRMFSDNARLSLLNACLTTRAMIPWPHRQLAPSGQVREKISLLHPVRSLRILMSGDNTPKRLAAAGALGVFLGALPLIALHTAAILFSASFLRLNKIAAVAASQVCMPPLVPAMCIELGYFLRHGRFLTEISVETLGYQGLERIWEWLLGSLVLAPLLSALMGGLIHLTASLIRYREAPLPANGKGRRERR